MKSLKVLEALRNGAPLHKASATEGVWIREAIDTITRLTAERDAARSDLAQSDAAIDSRCRVIVECSNDLAAARAKVEALREDAERYRKWRADYTDRTDEVSDLLIALADAWEPEQVDAAIDSARKAQATPTGSAT